MKDPIRPGPRFPHQWVPLLLAHLADGPDMEQACRLAGTTEAKVRRRRENSGYFDAAIRMILRGHRQRAREALAPKPEAVTVEDFVHHVSRDHATAAIVHADQSTLLLLCARIAHAAGIKTIEGHGVIDWFNHERRAELERQMLAIGDTDPALAEHLQRQFDAFKDQVGPDAIIQPPEA